MSTRRVFVLASLAAFMVLAAALEAPQASSAPVDVRLMRTRRQQLPRFTTHAVMPPPQPTHRAVRRAVDTLLRLPKRSAERLDSLVQRYPDCISVFEWRGFVHFITRSQLREAALHSAYADFDRAIQLAPKRADNYYCRASASFELGDWAAAEADCTRALEIGFGSFDSIRGPVHKAEWVLMSRAAIRARTGNWKGAIEDYSQLLEVQTASQPEEQSNSQRSGLHWYRALCFLKLQAPEAAIADYDVAVRIAEMDGISPFRVSSYGELLLDRAYAQVEAGHTQAARADFQKVVEIITQPSWEWQAWFPIDLTSFSTSSTLFTTHMSLGCACASLGEIDAAILSFERAAEDYAMHKTEVLRNQGLGVEAIKALQTHAKLCIEEIRG